MRVGEIHGCMRSKEQEAPPFLSDRQTVVAIFVHSF